MSTTIDRFKNFKEDKLNCGHFRTMGNDNVSFLVEQIVLKQHQIKSHVNFLVVII